MNKLFRIIAIALLVIGLAMPVYAGTVTALYQGANGAGTKVVVLVNSSSTAAKTACSTSYVIPGKCVLLGYSVTMAGSAGGTTSPEPELYIGLSDSTTGDADSYIIAESERAKATPFDNLFVKPLEFDNGIQVRQGPYTCVTLYYEQVRP